MGEIEYLTVAVWTSPETPRGYWMVTVKVASDLLLLRSTADNTMLCTLASTAGSPLIVTDKGLIVMAVMR